MRTKVALIIIAIAFVVTMANFGASLVLTHQSLTETVGNDITLALDIANDLVSTRIQLYMSNAQTAAERLLKADSVSEMEHIMGMQLAEFKDFIALTVFDRQGLITGTGGSTTPADRLYDSGNIWLALEGQTVISTTYIHEVTGELVMYISTPIGKERVLSVTIPGVILSELLEDYILWNSGNIFMIDGDSTVIANIDHELVLSRNSFMDMLKPSSPQATVDFINEVLSGEKGTGNYYYDGVEYKCVYARVLAAGVHNWHIGLTVPLVDNPVNQVQNRLILLASLFLVVTVIATVELSKYIVRPFNKIAQQNRSLEEYNDITSSMMAETLNLQAQLEAALKEAQDANSAKSRFLAQMSHEMRTPLNAVIGLSELILNSGEVWGRAEADLDKIHISGMTLLGLVNDILDISKIESGNFVLNPVEYDTPNLINDIVSLNMVLIGEKPVRFELSVDEKLPCRLYGDDLRIKQIFNNLLSNAIKFTDSGSVKWTVSFESEPDSDDIWLVSCVRDTGVGIKPDDIPNLFQDYTQMHSGIKRETEGTGLGLSITTRLVELMDGTVKVASEYGKGSTFSVRLRQQYVSDRPVGIETVENLMSFNYSTKKRTQRAGLARIDLSYAHVLVVDDMPTNLDITKGMLLLYGMHVDCADSGSQAIEMVRAESPRYDAIFMDHMMPVMDGIETTRIIREEIGTDYARFVPIIALSANAVAGNESMFLNYGFQAFVSKPVDINLLDLVLNQWVMDKDRESGFDAERDAGAANEEVYGSDHGELSADIMAIESIDTTIGLDRFAGNEDSYVKVLRSYLMHTRSLLDEMEKLLSSGDLNDYVTAAHGIKGSSLGIGAMRAGKDAGRLELIAKSGDIKHTLAENRLFTEYMGTLLDSVEAALIKYDSKHRKPVKASPEPELLQELLEACADYEAGRVDRAMTELESYEYERGADLVAWLRVQVEEMNYDVIARGDYNAGS